MAAASITVSSASGHDIWLSCGQLLLSRGLRVRIPREHFSVGLHLAAQRWVGTINTSVAQSCSRGQTPTRMAEGDATILLLATELLRQYMAVSAI